MDSRLIPQPTQPPPGRGTAAFGHPLPGFGGQAGNQPPPAQRFHDNDRNALGCCRLEPLAPRLGVFVQIVVLDLAEIPIVGLQYLQEGGRVPVEGETDSSNGSRCFLLLDPFPNSQIAQLVPGGQVGKHMHQVKVDVIRSQPGQLFLKTAFNPCLGFDQILGQFVRNEDFVPAAEAAQCLPQGGLAAAVHIGGIKNN